ncbi:hypothetical protein THAOC_20681, partial [Thalassiosira oceanica]
MKAPEPAEQEDQPPSLRLVASAVGALGRGRRAPLPPPANLFEGLEPHREPHEKEQTAISTLPPFRLPEPPPQCACPRGRIERREQAEGRPERIARARTARVETRGLRDSGPRLINRAADQLERRKQVPVTAPRRDGEAKRCTGAATRSSEFAVAKTASARSVYSGGVAAGDKDPERGYDSGPAQKRAKSSRRPGARAT